MPSNVHKIDRLLPCLLDRLVDENPDQRTEPPGGIGRGVTVGKYREGVLRDLRWLLNTKCHTADEGLDEFPAVESSVYNFGMPDPAGRALTDDEIVSLQRELTEAIMRYEPRILPNTLEVTAVATKDTATAAAANTVSFEISGDLWAAPLPERFFIKTDIDLETGKCVM